MKYLITLLLLVSTTEAFAGGYGLLFGPPGAGGGGTNPFTLSPIDMELNFLWDSGTELKLAVVPGILTGKRFRAQKSNLYLSTGGGFVVTRDGGNIGLYTDIGYETSRGKSNGFHFLATYSQALTYANNMIVTSYAARIGFCYAY